MARVTIYRDNAERDARRLSTEGRKDVAEQIKSEFEAIAPRRTGEYAGGASVTVDGDRVYVEDNDPEAFWKEYGTSRMRGIAALTNAARKHGKYSGFKPRGSRRG
ncbi:HK97 gp10 family phage protein [Rhodococcus qingshengii]|uniref:hypothetical protein n=1 Tax=Rhodococcus TaxID=1827 RepID=UPI0009B9FEAD|nr:MULTISPECIES: hypothetical protein [Rhodococcus]MDJ0405885.1 HK97 gp10 family phage protein [Rhodococcus erythropolis]OQM82023.1 hypothetical protein B0E55_01648 [Rhodococcus sp. 66b]